MDINIIAENLAELLTNTVNMTSVFYDVFLNPNPMDVTFQQYDDNNELVTVTIPNRAKDRQIAKEGTGTPEGHVTGSVGTAYVDTQNSVVYFKVSGDDQYGWTSILNREDAISIIRTYCANRGFINIDSVRTYLNNNDYVTTEQVASADTYGVVKIDNSSITNNGNGAIQAAGIINTNTTSSTLKKVWVGAESTFETLTQDPDTIYFLTDSGKIFVGKDEISAMFLPSLSSDNFNSTLLLSTPNTDMQYIIPVDGWLYFEQTSSAASQYLKITKANGQKFITYSTAASQTLTLSVPVTKGEVVHVYYTAAGSGTDDKFGIYVCKATKIS